MSGSPPRIANDLGIGHLAIWHLAAGMTGRMCFVLNATELELGVVIGHRPGQYGAVMACCHPYCRAFCCLPCQDRLLLLLSPPSCGGGCRLPETNACSGGLTTTIQIVGCMWSSPQSSRRLGSQSERSSLVPKNKGHDTMTTTQGRALGEMIRAEASFGAGAVPSPEDQW